MTLTPYLDRASQGRGDDAHPIFGQSSRGGVMTHTLCLDRASQGRGDDAHPMFGQSVPGEG